MRNKITTLLCLALSLFLAESISANSENKPSNDPIAHLFTDGLEPIVIKSQSINGSPLGTHYICATNDCAQNLFYPDDYGKFLKIGQEVYFINGSRGIIKYIVFNTTVYSPYTRSYEGLIVEVDGHLVRASTFTEFIDIVELRDVIPVRVGCLQKDLYSHFVKNDPKAFKLTDNGLYRYAGPSREVFTSKEYLDIALRNSLNDHALGCNNGFSEDQTKFLEFASSNLNSGLDFNSHPYFSIYLDQSEIDGLLKILKYIKKETNMNYNQFDHML